MVISVDRIGADIRGYCTAKKPPASEKLSRVILSALDKKSFQIRYEYMRLIDRIFHEENGRSENIKALKVAIASLAGVHSWKSALVSPHCKNEIRIHFPRQRYDNSLAKSIIYEERCTEYFGHPISAIFGSTFATSKPHILNREGHHLLDAAYGVVCLNSSGAFTGYALALADGAGGHLGEAKQDKTIARVAYSATKGAVRCLSAYEDADLLLKELDTIVQYLDQDIQSKALGEGTALVCCRAFPVKQGYRLIGFNIGDTLLAAWDPKQKRSYTFLPSHVSEGGVAIFPTGYRSYEVQKIDVIVPSGTTLFLMSDGVHDTLPFTESHFPYPNGVKCRVRELKEMETYINTLTPGPSVNEYLKCIVKKAINGAESLRQQQSNTQIGDDLSILGISLLTL